MTRSRPTIRPQPSAHPAVPLLTRQAVLWTLLLSLWLAAGSAFAARVPGLYGAEVDATGASGAGLDQAFDTALGLVLVKVTGLPDAGDPATRKRLVPNPAALVQQYTVQPGNRLRVDFDPAVLRRALDGANLPLWDADRPLVAIWLVADAGEDQRAIVSAVPAVTKDSPAVELDLMRQTLLETAAARALPVVLPQMDANDNSALTAAEFRDDPRGAIVAASERYGAEAVLIGRARSLDINDVGVSWTLLTAEEESSWNGTVAAGPAEAATVLSRQLATFADTGGVQRVVVTNVDSLAQYGSLLQYFRSLPIVERASIVGVDGRAVAFELAVRGAADRLQRALDTSGMLSAASLPAPPAGTAPRTELVYSLRAVQ